VKANAMATKHSYLSSFFRIALTRSSLLLRYAIVAVILVGVVYADALTAGWITWPALETQPLPTQIIDAFEAQTGPHSGFRRNHAKGICVLGHFESTGSGTALSRAGVSKKGLVPVVGGRSIPGSDPAQADGTALVRSFALRLTSLDGEEWRTGMNSVPLFTVRKPEELYAELVALRPDKVTGKADPARPAFSGTRSGLCSLV